MFKNSNIFFSKIFDMELIFAQEDNPQVTYPIYAIQRKSRKYKL